MKKRTHLLRVDGLLDDYGELFAAIAAEGLLAGWLDWQPADPSPDVLLPLPRGVRRSVEARAGEVRSRKAMRGSARLLDVVDEHFRGCVVVLVRARATDVDARIPALRPAGTGWVVESGPQHAERLEATVLAARLRRPRPFASPE